MADLVLNRAKGRVAEWAERVNANDPANAAFVVALLAATGVESDAVLTDKDDFAALVSGATNFATNTGVNRKVLDNEDGLTVTYDDTEDRVLVDMPDQTWTAVANDGTGAIGDLVIGYDPNSAEGEDSEILPATLHDLEITPDGSDITAQVAATGFFVSS